MSNQVLGTLHGFCNTKTEDGEIEKVYKNFTEGKLTSYLKNKKIISKYLIKSFR